MKRDAYKSHGKVFELKMGNVVIWKEIEENFMEYKNILREFKEYLEEILNAKY